MKRVGNRGVQLKPDGRQRRLVRERGTLAGDNVHPKSAKTPPPPDPDLNGVSGLHFLQRTVAHSGSERIHQDSEDSPVPVVLPSFLPPWCTPGHTPTWINAGTDGLGTALELGAPQAVEPEALTVRMGL